MNRPFRPTPAPRPSTPRLAAALVALLALVAALLTAPTATADPSDTAGAGGSGGDSDRPIAGPPAGSSGAATARITLVTGHVVAWQRTAEGRESAWLADAAPDPAGPPHVYEQDGEVHLVPAAAQAYVDSGVVDANLFNISRLVEAGLDDAHRDEWSLLVQSPPARRSAPATPRHATIERRLPGLGTLAVNVEKSDAEAMWASLRGPRTAQAGGPAQLSAGSTLWLNAPVRATLDDSVAKVRAPQAWQAGYDGTGVQVAVLDSGYDPDHPDLEGRVIEARDFTGSGDKLARDEHGHGTHVAATVGGSGEGADGTRPGVAPGTDLMIGKVLDANGSGTSDQILAAMEWAAHGGAEVVNMSLGSLFPSDGTDPMSQAVDRLTRQTGTLFVVAAGNIGPDEGSVTSPGAAPLALTVGAVDKRDREADFSSRVLVGDGPFRLKPEVVAPGVGIVAARAAGTSLGNLLDKHYTSLNGTSMATPHVAGAAAVVAQAHPGWDAAEIKERLVSTADPLADSPVGFQGGGRLDVRGAATDPVTTDEGMLDLGDVDHDDSRITREVRYTNATNRPLVLQLRSDVRGLGSDEKNRPDLTLSRRTVTVPARGTASVDVHLEPRDTRPGRYAGRLVAEVDGKPNRPVASLVSFEVDAPSHTLRIEAKDRQGGLASGQVDVWSAEGGAWERLFLEDGTASIEVAEGTYTVMAALEPQGTTSWPADRTIGGDPEVQITRDTVLRYDARDAMPVQVSTPKEAVLEGYEAYWQRQVRHRTFSTTFASGIPGMRLYSLRTPKARTGEFHVGTQWQHLEPTFSVTPTGGTALDPAPRLASERSRFVGSETLGVVDVGAGRPEDYAGVDVAGRVALAERDTEMSLQQQAEAAADAKAAALLVVNDRTTPWSSDFWAEAVPTYKVELAEGRRLRELVQRAPDTRLRLSGKEQAEYLYELAFVEDRIPRQLRYRVKDKDLAVVTSDYRENSDRMSRREAWVPELGPVGIGQATTIQRPGPVVRTEYLTATPGVRWQRWAAPHGEFPGFYWIWSALKQLRSGQQARQLWWGPAIVPGILPGVGNPELGAPVARFRDAIRVLMPHYDHGFGYGHIDEYFGDTSRLTLSSRGKVLGEATWPQAQFTVPAAAAEYQLRLEVAAGKGNMLDTAVRTDTTWTFRSGRSEGRTVLPLLEVRYALPGADSHNRVPAGTPTRLVLRPAYQPGADGPDDFQVSARVSYDDGDSWTTARVEQKGARYVADLPGGSGPYADVEVTVTDSDGTAVTQRVDHAWKVGRG